MKIAVLTPAPDQSNYAAVWPELYRAYHDLFVRHGATTVALPWTDDPAGCGADAVLPLLAWGYHEDEPAWRARLGSWPARLPLVNRVETLLWNTRKTYLAALDLAGVAIVPTRFVGQDLPAACAAAWRTFGCGTLVVKPQVSAGAHNTILLSPNDPVPALEDAMIQPFLPSIRTEGELSLFYFGGRFAYAVRKRPAPGDFRVQPVHGGVLALERPDADAIALAERAIAATPVPLAYARIDIVRDGDGRACLMELEVIEPDLYLSLAPDGGGAFALHVLDHLRQPAT